MLSKVINSFFNSIDSVNINSDDIEESLLETSNVIRTCSLSVVKQCIEDTKNIDFSNNKEYMSTLLTVSRHFRLDNKLNLFQSFEVILDRADDTVNGTIVLVKKYFTETVDKDSMTYPRLQILALSETIDFISEFIPKYCHYIIAKHNEVSGGLSVNKILTKYRFNWVKNNTLNFYKSLTSLASTRLNDVEKMLSDMPDVMVTPNGDEEKIFDKNKLDPSGIVTSRFLSATFNPFYYIRMKMIDFSHDRYKLNKEEVETIKVELEALNSQIQNGQVDAYTERQRILAMERMSKLEYDIAKYEEKALNTRY